MGLGAGYGQGNHRFGGKIDVLVNNAVIDPPAPSSRSPLSSGKKIIDINLTGSFLMMRATIPP
jgi:NAD(P)-dependent dehydrogenase (short-subunit alcohol dehydrogenase family)